MARRKMPRGRDRRVFRQTANRTNAKNLTLHRGGTLLK